MPIPSHQQLTDALRSSGVEHLSTAAQERLQWIIHFVEHKSTVTETCARFGIARATFHRWLERFDIQNFSSLEDRPTEHAPRTSAVSAEIIALIRSYRQAFPQMGKEQISNLLAVKHGHVVSGSTVGRVIERECLYFAATPLHWRKRQRLEERRAIQANAPAHGACPCGWCRFHKQHWPLLRRRIALASVLAPVAIIGLFAYTVLWERSRMEESTALPASVIDLSVASDQ